MTTINAILDAEKLAKELQSPECINWDNLNTMYAMKGKEHTLKLIENEKQGANNVYLAHLSLAETALNQMP
jgi:hypothetical protein